MTWKVAPFIFLRNIIPFSYLIVIHSIINFIIGSPNTYIKVLKFTL